MLPAADVEFLGTFTPDGYVPPKGAGLNLAWIPQVMGNYFQAQGIPIVRGRDFTLADDANAALVVIVNRTLAEHYWPGQDPIGKRLHRGPAEAHLPWLTVVGEIGDVKELAADFPTEKQFYIPAQARSRPVLDPSHRLAFSPATWRHRGPLASCRPSRWRSRCGRSFTRSIRSSRLTAGRVDGSGGWGRPGFAPIQHVLISAFAGAAVLLAVLGIYSVIAFSAAMRIQEMAIRLALGSQRSGVMRLVLVSGAKLGLAGCGIGAVAAVFATRLLRSMLFEVDPLDPVVLVVAAVSILLLALAASVIPARRAASIEPMEALRTE